MKVSQKARNIMIGVAFLAVVCCIVGYLGFRALQKVGLIPENTGTSYTSAAEAVMSDWVPFVVDNSEESALEGFLYKGEAVEPAAVKEAAATASKDDRVTGSIKKQVPDYPFEQIPLIKPDMLVTAAEKPFDQDISINVMYYTLSSPDDTLAFYRQALGKYENFNEDVQDSSAGKSYILSFNAEGKYKMDASVMVMEMPKTTGYTCAVNVQIAVRGAAKKEVQTVENRTDGLPGNYPDNYVPVYKISEIYTSEGDSKGCDLQYDSSASYKDTVDFYRSKLNGKTDFGETNDVEGEVSFYCLVPGWEIYVRIMDNSGNGYVEINCYVQ